jgi:hypothetical protein
MFSLKQSKRLSRALMFAFSITALCVILSGTATAQSWNKRTTMTFSAPVEIPGVGAQVLPAGTYVFRLLDSLSDRHIVQIFNEDESHLFATILAIPNYRLRATDKTVVTFAERAAGEPQAIRAWFYPGDNSGQEFVYPKKRAVELAKATKTPIIFVPEEVAPFIIAPIRAATEPPVIALREAPLKVVTPAGEEVEIAEVVEPPPVQTASLPKTAGDMPLLALMGFLCLSVGISLRTLWVR